MDRRGVVMATCLLACQSPRPQLLVEISTDLGVDGAEANDHAAVGTIDRVRVERLTQDGAVSSSRDFMVANGDAFPLSFGALAVQGEQEIRLRILGYRLRNAGSNAQPFPGATLERTLRTQANALDEHHVALSGECLGTNECDDSTPLRRGEFAALQPTPCSSEPPAGTQCIAGGLGLVGDPELAHSDTASGRVANEPRLFVSPPFFLDTHEMRLADVERLAQEHAIALAPDSFCVHAGEQRATTPAQCVSFEFARAICRARGGDLPTAVQWEYTARGRGDGRAYPWGEAEPRCCSAALAAPLGCTPRRGTGAYGDTQECDGRVDVSRDGVFDLAGGAQEWVLDGPVPLTSCGALSLDPPRCVETGSIKGGGRDTSLVHARAALRFVHADQPGFRCAFSDR